MSQRFRKYSRLAVGVLFIGAVRLCLADDATTQPTAPTTQLSPFAGGQSFSETTPPSTQPTPLPFVSPLSGSSSGSGNRPGDLQVGNGIGPSQGDREPNAAVPVVPQPMPATKPTR